MVNALAARPPSYARPGGYPHAVSLAALVNAGWLLTLNLAITVAAIQRLAAGARHVDGLPVVIASGIAAAVMLAGALILRGDPGNDGGGEDLTIKAVLLDTAANSATASGVAASGAIILAARGWGWLDPGSPSRSRGHHLLSRPKARPPDSNRHPVTVILPTSRAAQARQRTVPAGAGRHGPLRKISRASRSA